MKKKYIASALVVPAFLLALSGCGATEEVQESSDPVEVVESESVDETLLTIGDNTEDAYDVILTNSTGSDIDAITVECDGEELVTAEDAGILEDMAFELFCEPVETEDTSAGTNDKLLSPEYNVTITIADGTEYTLHGFPFDDIEEGEIFIDDIEDVAYIVYDSIDSDEEVNTLEDEIATKEMEEDTAAADAAAQAVTKSSSSSSSSTSSSSYSGSSSSSTSGSSSSTSGSSSSTSGSTSTTTGGSEDGCLEDGLTY